MFVEAANPSLRRAALVIILRLRQYIHGMLAAPSLPSVVSAHLVAYSSGLGNLAPPRIGHVRVCGGRGVDEPALGTLVTVTACALVTSVLRSDPDPDEDHDELRVRCFVWRCLSRILLISGIV